MSYKYDPQAIFAGLRRQDQLNEQEGDAFTTFNKKAELTPKELDKSGNRMAGQAMARELDLMNDPAEAERTFDWMGRFSVSNQGFEWNQGRMNMEAFEQEGGPMPMDGQMEAG